MDIVPNIFNINQFHITPHHPSPLWFWHSVHSAFTRMVFLGISKCLDHSTHTLLNWNKSTIKIILPGILMFLILKRHKSFHYVLTTVTTFFLIVVFHILPWFSFVSSFMTVLNVVWLMCVGKGRKKRKRRRFGCQFENERKEIW